MKKVILAAILVLGIVGTVFADESTSAGNVNTGASSSVCEIGPAQQPVASGTGALGAPEQNRRYEATQPNK